MAYPTVVVFTVMALIDLWVWMWDPEGIALLRGVVLLEEVYYCGGWLWGYTCSSYVQSHSLLLLPLGQDVELSASSPAPCISGCCHNSHHEDNGLKLWSCKPAPSMKVAWSWCVITWRKPKLKSFYRWKTAFFLEIFISWRSASLLYQTCLLLFLKYVLGEPIVTSSLQSLEIK